MVRTYRLTSLCFALNLLFTACVVFPVAPDSAEQKNELSVAVEATVDAAIGLAVEATIAARDAQDTSAQGQDPAAAAEDVEQASVSGDEPPLLITPTPDQSAEIMAFILANTRHFRGDPDAPVVLVEFSDFL